MEAVLEYTFDLTINEIESNLIEKSIVLTVFYTRTSVSGGTSPCNLWRYNETTSSISSLNPDNLLIRIITTVQ